MIAGVEPALQLFLAAVAGSILHELLPLLPAFDLETVKMPRRYKRWQWYIVRGIVAIATGAFALQLPNVLAAFVIGLAGPAFFDTYVNRHQRTIDAAAFSQLLGLPPTPGSGSTPGTQATSEVSESVTGRTRRRQGGS